MVEFDTNSYSDADAQAEFDRLFPRGRLEGQSTLKERRQL